MSEVMETALKAKGVARINEFFRYGIRLDRNDELAFTRLIPHLCDDESGKLDLALALDRLGSLLHNPLAVFVLDNRSANLYGDAAVTLDMADLMEDDMRKLMGLLLKGSEHISDETLKQDWSQIDEMELSQADMEKICAEVRIIPVKSAGENSAYAVSVWLRWGNEAIEVSKMIPSLKVCLNAEKYVFDGALDALCTLYAVGFHADASKDAEAPFLPLESEVLLIPEELPEMQADTAKRFIVRFNENDENAVVAYEKAAELSLYRHTALCASFAGAGEYTIIER